MNNTSRKHLIESIQDRDVSNFVEYFIQYQHNNGYKIVADSMYENLSEDNGQRETLKAVSGMLQDRNDTLGFQLEAYTQHYSPPDIDLVDIMNRGHFSGWKETPLTQDETLYLLAKAGMYVKPGLRYDVR